MNYCNATGCSASSTKGKKLEQRGQRNPRAFDGLKMRSPRSFSCFKAQQRHNFLQVLPDFTLRVRVAQQISGVVRGEQFCVAEVKPDAAISRNRVLGSQQRLRSCVAEANNRFGSDRIQLAIEIGRTGCDLIVGGCAVFRRAALHYVADVYVLALEAHRFNHLRQELSSTAHKRQPLNIFVMAGSLADKHELCMRIPYAKNNFVALLVPPAAAAFAQGLADSFERIVLDPVDRLKKGSRVHDRKNGKRGRCSYSLLRRNW